MLDADFLTFARCGVWESACAKGAFRTFVPLTVRPSAPMCDKKAFDHGRALKRGLQSAAKTPEASSGTLVAVLATTRTATLTDAQIQQLKELISTTRVTPYEKHYVVRYQDTDGDCAAGFVPDDGLR
ncbi:MAG TPA: hypothetical protein VJN18_23710 [Polyangiaceae bacterium]|nr:hypothetical protein [Polyangiaceae bacterium]